MNKSSQCCEKCWAHCDSNLHKQCNGTCKCHEAKGEESWEKEFDKKFLHNSSWPDCPDVLNTEDPEAIKQFISQTLLHREEELVKAIEDLEFYGRAGDERHEWAARAWFKCKEAIITIIKNK